MRLPRIRRANITATLVVAVVCSLCLTVGNAQSGDAAFPAPVFSNEIGGRVLPRDLGDARRTRHFYTFRGTEGDLIVTVESADLDGDVDVFAGRTLRPLLKVTLFGGAATKATKSFYLRKEETLILRVEARAVGDAEGRYRILLGGSFAPAPADLARVEDPTAVSSSDPVRTPGTRRVTSTGARIDEPRIEVVEAAPSPTPEPAPGVETPVETPRVGESTPARTAPNPPRRTTRGRSTPTRRRTPPARTPDRPDASETAESRSTTESTTPAGSAEKPEATETPSEAATSPSTRARSPSRTSRRRPANVAATVGNEAEASPASPAPVVTILKFVVVTKDGMRREHEMSAVRRVIVENNQLVIVMRDGRVVRTPLALVEKMSFEP